MADNKEDKKNSNYIAPEHKYLKDVPSPVSLEYPYRNMSRIVGSIPTSLTKNELLKAIANYYNEFPYNKESPSYEESFDRFRNLEKDISNAYIDDIIKSRDASKIEEGLRKDFNWTPEENKKVNIIYEPLPLLTPDDKVGATQYNTRTKNINIKANLPHEKDENFASVFPELYKNIMEKGSKISIPNTLYHEMNHADDFLKYPDKDYDNEKSDTSRFVENGKNLPKEIHQDPFELAKYSRSTYHNEPIEGDYRLIDQDSNYYPKLILKPFEDIQTKSGKERPQDSFFTKLKKLISNKNYIE